MEFISTVIKYLWAVFINWWWLLTAGLFLLDKILEWFWPGYRTWLNHTFPAETRRRYFWRALFAFVFIAGFFAWKDEHERANRESVRAGGLQSQINGGVAQELQEELAQAKKERASAKAQAEEAGAQIAKLQEQLAPRRINKKEEFVQALRKSGASQVKLIRISGDEEVAGLDADLRDLLVAGGWQIRDSGSLIPMTLWKGVIITVWDLNNIPPGAVLLAELLKENDIVASMARDPQPSHPPDVFSVYIGHKP